MKKFCVIRRSNPVPRRIFIYCRFIFIRMDLEKKTVLGDLAATSLITLYCHAIETRSKEPLLYDPKSVEIAEALDRVLAGSDKRLERDMAGRNLNPALVVHVAIRAKKYDNYVRDFLKIHPEGVVVNIGCGLDSRFYRIDNGKVRFYDLDLPEVIKLKRHFFEETDRYRMIASSVLDYGWMDEISIHSGPFLFMAEGVFMYLEGEDVKSLVLTLRERFPGSELVCEVFNSLWLKGLLGSMVLFKLRRRMHLGKDAVFRSGIRRSGEMEEWHPGIRLLEEWSYFDSGEKKLGWLKIFSRIGFLRHIQWTVYYRLGRE